VTTQIDVRSVLARLDPERKDLVTRPTGRAVRSSIEVELAALAEAGFAVVVLDFNGVRLMDLSCADEIVAKLLQTWMCPSAPARVCFLLRGLDDHLLEDIEHVLRPQQLTLVAETQGTLRLVGEASDPWRLAFARLAERGRAAAEELAADLAWPLDEVRSALDQLALRRLVVEESGHYLPPCAA
jgi:hypothetical protein